MRRWVFAAVLVLATVGSAGAQSTGSSMGGGSWGGSSGSSWSGSSGSSWSGSSGSSWSGSSGSSWSWGSSSSSSSSWSVSSWSGASDGSSGYYGRSDTGSGSSLSGCSGIGAREGAFIFGIGFVLLCLWGTYVWVSSSEHAPAVAPYIAPARRQPQVDVSVLRLAIDWRARAGVQKELDRIARTTDLSTNDGLLSMLREVAMTLRRCKDSWLYAGVVDAQPMTHGQAEAFFTRQAHDARSRYRTELTRAGAGGVATRDDPAHLVAGFDEGEGLVVVTIVMAVRGTLNDFGLMTSVENVRAWFEGLNYVTSGSLVACEVVWSPAAEKDRLSSAELEVLYPELRKLHHAVPAGRVACEHCRGLFPAELERCPRCGGTAHAAA